MRFRNGTSLLCHGIQESSRRAKIFRNPRHPRNPALRGTSPRLAARCARFPSSGFRCGWAGLGTAVILALSQAAAAADVSLEVGANRNQIYLGESVILSVKVSGESSPPEPDLSGIKDFKIRSLGSQSQDQVSIMIINGKVTRSGFFGRLFSYELTPEKTGEFPAGPVQVTAGGKTLAAPGPSIRVVGLEKQDYVTIRVTPSRETVLVDETFDVTLSILLRRLPGAHSELDPLDPRDPPNLQVPFLDENPPASLEAPDIRQPLEDHIRRTLEHLLVPRPDRPGFGINSYTVRTDPLQSMFDVEGLFEKRPAKFSFPQQRVDQDGKPCFEYRLKLTYRAKEEASHTFGPVIFKGGVITSIDAGNRVVKQPVFAVGPACVVRVVPPPEENRPLSFIGAIGTNLVAEASLDAQVCKVGDPLKLTVALSGPAGLRNVRPPPLGVQEDLVKNFRVYDDTVETVRKDNGVQFVWTVRPITSGTLEIPPLNVSYYDPARQAYRTATTRPIPVQARPAEQVRIEDLGGLSTNEAAAPAAVNAGRLVIAPITLSPAGAEHVPLYPPRGWHAAVALAGPLLAGLVVSIRALRRRAAEKVHRDRRLGACRRALWALHDARRAATKDPTEASRLIVSALRKYLADRLGGPEGSLTPGDAADLLARHSVATEIVAPLQGILQKHFDAYYQAGDTKSLDPLADCERAAALLEETDRALAATEERTRSAPGD